MSYSRQKCRNCVLSRQKCRNCAFSWQKCRICTFLQKNVVIARMFGVFAIDENPRYRGNPVPALYATLLGILAAHRMHWNTWSVMYVALAVAVARYWYRVFDGLVRFFMSIIILVILVMLDDRLLVVRLVLRLCSGRSPIVDHRLNTFSSHPLLLLCRPPPLSPVEPRPTGRIGAK